MAIKIVSVSPVFVGGPPALRTILEFLDKAPHDEIYDVRELARRIGLAPTTIQQFLAHHLPPGCRARFKKQYFYGNAKAIAAFCKERDRENY